MYTVPLILFTKGIPSLKTVKTVQTFLKFIDVQLIRKKEKNIHKRLSRCWNKVLFNLKCTVGKQNRNSSRNVFFIKIWTVLDDVNKGLCGRVLWMYC